MGPGLTWRWPRVALHCRAVPAKDEVRAVMVEGMSVLAWLQFNLRIFYYEACGSAPMIVARWFGLDSLRFHEGFITD